jgi:hypothetical protein
MAHRLFSQGASTFVSSASMSLERRISTGENGDAKEVVVLAAVFVRDE